MDYFAVIDTETNWNNEVMSIGVVIAEKNTFKKVDDLYFIFDPEYKIGGMFSMVLPVKGRAPKDLLFTRKIAMEKFKEAFEKYGVKDLFAYNGTFDKNLLNELASYRWFDIMKIAAYRQYNVIVDIRKYITLYMMQLMNLRLCGYLEKHLKSISLRKFD